MQATNRLCFLLLAWCLPLSAQVINNDDVEVRTATPISGSELLNIETKTLARLDYNRIAAEDQANATKGQTGGWRFAIASDLDYTPINSGTWKDNLNGTSQWRLNIVATDAVHLNFGFKTFRLPASGSMSIQRPDGKHALGPYTARDQTPSLQLWTPILVGDGAVIVLDVATAERHLVELNLIRISQGYRGFGYQAAWYKSGSCNMDVACIPNGDTWNDQRGSVGAYTMGGTDTCTGSLVNNTNNDRRMLFATAAHCNVNAGNIATMLVFWRFENLTCRTPGSPASGTPIPKPSTTSAGLTWLATTINPFAGGNPRPGSAKSDWTIVELAQPNATNLNLYWAGFDRRDSTSDVDVCAAPTSGGSTAGTCASIHHPSVDEKRITFVNGNLGVNNIANAVGVHWNPFWAVTPPILVNATPGVTEPGSSGSPLYSANKRLIGVLSGGPSACGATGGNLSDSYGGLFASWDGVGVLVDNQTCAQAGSTNTCMRPHLDPANTNPEFIDGIGECTPPAIPTGLTATAGGANQINLSWSSVAGAELYRVFRSNGACPGTGATQIAEIAGTTYSDTTGVSGGSTYSYTVSAVNTTPAPICESARSTCDDAVATGACSIAPTFAGATSVQSTVASTCGLTVNWSGATSNCAAPNPPVFNVYRSTTSGFVPSAANRIASCQAVTVVADNNVAYGNNYFYVVRAEDPAAVGSGVCGGLEESNVVQRSGSPTGLVTTANITDTFEGALSGGGFDTAGWTNVANVNTTTWSYSTAQSNSPTHSWFSDSLPAVALRTLVSPSFGALANTTLSFFHTFNFENGTTSCFDAGTLETSNDGGTTWTVLPDAAFTAGGFTGTVSTSFSSPIAGKRAWCSGTIGPMTQVSANLGAFAGQNIQVRWAAGDDSSAEDVGWFVDSVTITNAGTAGSCSFTLPDPIFSHGFED